MFARSLKNADDRWRNKGKKRTILISTRAGSLLRPVQFSSVQFGSTQITTSSVPPNPASASTLFSAAFLIFLLLLSKVQQQLAS